MATVNSGNKRSLTVDVTKSQNGIVVSRNTYNGLAAFTWNSVNYTAITPQDLMDMSESAYTTRLAAFTAYVESIEVGLDFDTDTVPGYEPVIFDVAVCPLPSSYFIVTVESNNALLGSVIGAGTYLTGSSCTIKAFPAAGAKFDGWEVSIGGVAQPSIGDVTYTFTVTQNIDFVAIFSTIVVTTFTASYSNYVCEKVA